MRTVVVFSGAGLSKESGIPTFRDSKDGLWHNHKIEDVADAEGWKKDPALVLEFYEERWNNIQACQPNDAHKAIASLQDKFNVINITQNIDDLLERAGCDPLNVNHLHGCINRRKCEWHHNISMLDGDTIYKCTNLKVHQQPVKLGDRCEICGGQMRPDVVWFGEAVDMRGSYFEDLAKVTDIFIGVGTSAQVMPAAGMLFTFRIAQQKYFINLNPPLRLQSFTRLAGTACEHLPKLAERLLNEEASSGSGN